MRLYMIRHGETEWNKVRRLQGQTDIALNETGRDLALRVGTAMAEIPFTRVISSPLNRAVETAGLVLSGAGKQLEIGTDPRIMEIAFGEFEGYSTLNPEYFHPAFGAADSDFHNFFDAPDKYRAPKGGESIHQLIERTGDFLRELAESEALTRPAAEAGAGKCQQQEAGGADAGKCPKQEAAGEETILISTHGAALRALLANIKHTPVSEFWNPGVPVNCSVSIARTENGNWKLEKQDVLYY